MNQLNPNNTGFNSNQNQSNSYPELKDIKQDLESLKRNTVGLAKHVQDDGKEQMDVMTDKAKHGLKRLRDAGAENLHALEEQVQRKPGQSIALAFAAGLITSYFLNRR